MYNFEDIRIDGELTQYKFNSGVQKLIKNDNLMTYQTISPTTWECKWYDVPTEQTSSFGYSKGDAVWINTKDLDEFVYERKSEIIEYVKLYSWTNRQYMMISSDTNKLMDFLKSFVTGDNDYDSHHKHIFYIGDISCATQIRISKENNNTSLPSDDSKWYDFIDRSYDESYYEHLVLSILETQQEEKLNTHLRNYHLSGIITNDGTYRNNREFTDMFLDSSLSNAQNTNIFTSHKYTNSLSGFDYVTEYYLNSYSNGGQKWFRKWKSGLLEHGGIVIVGDNIIKGDELYYNQQFYQVSLNWTYGQKTAQVYDYKPIKMGTFYMRDTQIDTGNGYVMQYDKQQQQVDWDQRYQISITPLYEGTDEIENPYYFSYGSTTPHYTIKEITNMTNNSFRFKYSENFSEYSYYVRGFVKNA